MARGKLKEVWKAVVSSVGVHLAHHYTDNTLTGAEHMVNLVLCLERETGRYVRLELTVKECDNLRLDLAAAAQRAENYNKRYL